MDPSDPLSNFRVTINTMYMFIDLAMLILYKT